MANWIKKYRWILLILLIVFPFLLNFIVICYTPFDLPVAGEPKDWILFWGTYISSIASLGMIILTYIIIKQNDEIRRGTIVFKIIGDGRCFYIHYKNIGNSVAYIKQLNFNDDFVNKLNDIVILKDKSHKETFTRISNRRIYLNPQEEKKIFLGECAAISKNIELIKTPIKITGRYESIGKSFEIKDEFCIDDFNFESVLN